MQATGLGSGYTKASFRFSIHSLKAVQKMASRNQTAVKRLIQELRTYEQESSEALRHLGPVREDELMHWQAVMKGIPGTAYEGGRWLLDIQIPPNYPLSPPTVRFATRICHPNIHFQTGEICLDLLKTSWSPAYTIVSTLESVRQLLTSAEPDSPLNVDIAKLFRDGDEIGARGLIGFFTEAERYDGRP